MVITMKELTNRERIMRIFRNEEYDRPALKLWGAGPGQWLLHESYRPVRDLAWEVTDIFAEASSPFNIYCGSFAHELITRKVSPTESPLWNEAVTTYKTPLGDLTERFHESTVMAPGYITEYAVKDITDLKKLLSMPYEPYGFDAANYWKTDGLVGEKGICMFNLDHPGYALQRMMGSETLAYLTVDERDTVREALELFAGRIRRHAEAAVNNGINGVFSWVGPEILTPPLMGYGDFEDFVINIDEPLCGLIHSAGGYTWLHCHGKVSKLIGRFKVMGIDVLNPLEPPKNGDVSMEEIVNTHGRTIGFEGNIEIQDILQCGTEELKEKISSCVQAGAKSGRFILCPSAGYMEYPEPEEKYIHNLLTYLHFGLEEVKRYKQ